jgi:hypothetical protein
MLIEHNALGGKPIQRRGIDPAIAIAADVAQWKAAQDKYKHVHTPRLYAVCEWLAMRYNGGMSKIVLGPISFDRVVQAVEAVRNRLLRATASLESAGIPYAVVGGNAVAVWVARIDPAAVRNTQDVDILVRRSDLDAVTSALQGAGFVRRNVLGVEMFLEGPRGRPRDGVHVLFAGEKVRPEYSLPAPELTDTEQGPQFRIVNLDALVRMKLTSFRRKDQVHIEDMLDVGLIDASWCQRLPADLAARLQEILNTPDG